MEKSMKKVSENKESRENNFQHYGYNFDDLDDISNNSELVGNSDRFDSSPKRKIKNRRLHVVLSDEAGDALEELSQIYGTSKTAIVEAAILSYPPGELGEDVEVPQARKTPTGVLSAIKGLITSYEGMKVGK